MYKLKPRKIQAMDHTFHINLPIEWLRNHGITKGDALNLIIGPEEELILKPMKNETN